MHGARVERIQAVPDAQETGRLLESLGSQFGDLSKISPGFEGAVFIPMAYDVSRELRPETRDVHQQLFACRIDLDTDGIDAAHHYIVETALENALVDVMLVLADPD